MANRERQGGYEGRGRREQGRNGGQRERQGQQDWRRGRESDEDRGSTEEWRGSGYGDEPEWGQDEGRGQRFGGSFPGESERYGAGRDAEGWSQQGDYGRGGYGQQGYGGYGQQGGRYGSHAGQQWRFGQQGRGQRGGFGQQGFGQQGQHEQLGSFAGRGPKGYRRSDERVLEEVSQALEDHPEIDASEIEVSCAQGEIVLKGTVDDRHAKRMAEQCVEEVTGVKDVRNELRVSARHGESQQSSSSSSRPGMGTRGSSRESQ